MVFIAASVLASQYIWCVQYLCHILCRYYRKSLHSRQVLSLYECGTGRELRQGTAGSGAGP